MMLSALKKFTDRPRPPEQIANTMQRCFSTMDGKKALDILHQHTLFRVVDPTTSHEQLRFLEGQRQLVLWICQMIAKSQQ